MLTCSGVNRLLVIEAQLSSPKVPEKNIDSGSFLRPLIVEVR